MNFATYSFPSAATPSAGAHTVKPYPSFATALISVFFERSVPGFTLAFTSAPSFVSTFTVPFVASSDLKVTVI